MRSERGRAVDIALSALGSKDHAAGPSKVPLRRICQAIAEDPSAECGEGAVASSRHDNLPRSPSKLPETKFGRRGFDNFSRRVGLGDMVSTHGRGNFAVALVLHRPQNQKKTLKIFR